MEKAQRAADMLSGALSLLGEDATSAEARERLGLPPSDGAFGEEEPGAVVQRAMQQARTTAEAERVALMRACQSPCDDGDRIRWDTALARQHQCCA